MSDSGPYNDPLTGPQIGAALRTVDPAAVRDVNAGSPKPGPIERMAPLAALAAAPSLAYAQSAFGLRRRKPFSTVLMTYLTSR